MVHRQPQLFAPLVVAAGVQLLDFGPGGWQVHIVTRRDGEAWGDEPAAHYSELTAAEAYDAVCADLAYRLGLVPG